ncbi:MAG: S-layer homology domain-containing protein [Coleofasciculus chthonoplastes F3-SA18-01]|uniref:S-layer homology domain-containing protein n=1 Tax=Coleofasciculus chthonoplastes TaxID=64178 RepID=UPI0033005804
MHHWGYIVIGSVVGSTLLSVAANIASPQSIAQAQTNPQANQKDSLGESLLNNMLGADALRPQNSAPNTAPNTTQPAQTAPTSTPSRGRQIVQATTFPDIQGNWAQAFIQALASRGIIRGFPDGTFRPNAPVTRAQFAAMIRQAFEQPLERPATQFSDIPANFWALDAIQEAYRMGFMEGYPNNIFLPDQNIPRVQVLVALVSGLDLSAPAQSTALLNRTFQDAAQIPDWAQTSIAAATVNQMVVNYPNVAFLNPNQTATRADVAAFIYQALVSRGQLPQIPPSTVASRYIVGYEPIAQDPPPPTPEQVAALRRQYLLPAPPVEEQLRRIVRGGSSINTPTAFGAQTGNIFFGATYQEQVRFFDEDDGAVVVGFGVGDARKIVALETAVSIYDLFGDTFEDGGVSFKLHRLIGDDLAVAVGVENAIVWGNTDGDQSVYGVVSKVFRLRENPSDPFSRLTASVGLGGGRFRSENDIEDKEGSTNVFGSVGLQVVEPITLIADWTGQDLYLGASIVPIKGVPLVITPAVADVTGNAGDEPRFILGIGYGLSF